MSSDMSEWIARLRAEGYGDGWVGGVDRAEAGGDKTTPVMTIPDGVSFDEALGEMAEIMRQNRYDIGSIIHPGLSHDEWIATIVQVDEEMETAVNRSMRATRQQVWQSVGGAMSTLMMWLFLAIAIAGLSLLLYTLIVSAQHKNECRDLGYDKAVSYSSGVYCVREDRVPLAELQENGDGQ